MKSIKGGDRYEKYKLGGYEKYKGGRYEKYKGGTGTKSIKGTGIKRYVCKKWAGMKKLGEL